MQGTRPILGDQEQLLGYLSEAFIRGSQVKIIVSFLMESGVLLLQDILDDLVDRGALVQVITSRYLNLTQPSALYLLKERYNDKIDLRFFNDISKSFHPKTYIVHFSNGEGCVFVGSSNISRSALTTGIEWNYRVDKVVHPDDFQEFDLAFDEIYKNDTVEITDEVLRNYAKNWKRPKIQFDKEVEIPKEKVEVRKVVPKPVQREALYELKKTRDEGYDKALVIAATGVGKTYLSAFDASNFERILFVAHRQEILQQAEKTYQEVMPGKSASYFMGKQKETDADIIFAMIQTLGKEQYLVEKYFKQNDFQYIVVDEFHHAAANTYQRLLEYFKPEFLLGLTATPFRMDNREIFSLCDNNVAYEVTLKDAINRGWLVPFRYYGVSDIVNYDDIDFKNGSYDDSQLERALSTHERAELVLKHYLKYRSGKGLGFCASTGHAEFMTEYFRQFEIKAAVVHSKQSDCEYLMARNEAIEALKRGELDIVFCVDMFNEGVDIPIVDLVLFLRPTESYTVFLQQLGRGLRKYDGKDYLTILDFIGNYKNVQAKINFFGGDIETDEALDKVLYNPREYEELLPDGCIVDFDFRLIDLFKQLKMADSLESRLRIMYQDVKNLVNRRPTRYDMFRFSRLEVGAYLKNAGNWLRFLDKMVDLTEEEKSWLGTPAEEFLRFMEKTSMSKSYKIPVFLSLVDGEEMYEAVTIEEVGRSFQDFYVNHKFRQKDLNNKRHKNWQDWDLPKYIKEAKMNPVKFLRKSDFYCYDDVEERFGLLPELIEYFSPAFTEHFLDVVTWREKNYFSRRY